MPRPKRPPRLALRKDRDGIRRYVIRDGEHYERTGCLENDLEGASEKLALYLARKREPVVTERRPQRLTIGDVLMVYLTAREEKVTSLSEFEARIARLNEFWGHRAVADIRGDTCRAYVQERAAKARKRGNCGKFTSGPRRELEDLRAAVNLYAKEYGLDVVPRVTLPEKPPERQRWLTRSEAAALLAASLRLRRKSPSHYGHLPRFILLGLYTGTRHRAILGLNWNPGIGGGWPDLENGVLYRKGIGATETKKRQPPMRLPPRLLAHLARWKRLDLGRGPVVHNSEGEAIKRLEKAFRTVRSEAGLSTDVVPHVLRHTRATWLMQHGVDIWQAAGSLGMTVEQLEKTYGHHHPDFQKGAAEAF